jgi:hypothetical protein
MSFTHCPARFTAAVAAIRATAAKRWLIKSLPGVGSNVGKIG